METLKLVLEFVTIGLDIAIVIVLIKLIKEIKKK